MKGALALDESGNNNDAMLINGAELAYEGGKCDSGVTLSGIVYVILIFNVLQGKLLLNKFVYMLSCGKIWSNAICFAP